jgi:Tol biopolymer transport system component
MKRAAILTFALLALVPAFAHAAFPGRNGAIVYGYDGYSYNEDDYSSLVERGIYVKSGWHKRRLFGCTEVVFSSAPSSCDRHPLSDPAVSPNGTPVAFDAGTSLGVVGIDGRGFRLLPARTADDGQPAFAPTGTQLVFTGARGDLWIRDLADDSSARQLVRGASSPAWSTHDWIAFVRAEAIYRVRPDGRGLRRLARNGSAPTWSPDGTRLAFTRSSRSRHGRIVRLGGLFVVDADGGHLRRLPRQERDADSFVDLAWSPDGRRLLAFDDAVIAVDLSGRMRHGFGVEDYDGANSIDSIYGVDWRPLPE